MATLFVVGLFCFLAFIIYAVWRTECYDESESFLYNVGVTLLALLFWFVIAPAVVYALLGGFANPY